MTTFIWTFTFVVSAFGSVSSQENLVITTLNGPVRGITAKTPLGKSVSVFYGIPFAKPPVGELRFKPPQPVASWTDVLNATSPPASCFQRDFSAFNQFNGVSTWIPSTPISEDCLKLNIFVPDHSWSSQLAVMVYIHGGGFSVGSSTIPIFDGSVLASEEGVIVVPINYRLASLGFLYLDSQEIPGNAGLYDQVMAMQWVKMNIHRFGGDPEKITLFGQSAGASSVAYHLLSNLSSSYFARAILESGGATNPWALMSKKASLEAGHKLVEFLDCQLSNATAVSQCLRSKSPEDIIINEPIRGYADVFVFRPIVDGWFLSEEPKELLRKANFKKCNILIGTNRNEASIFIMGLLPHVFPFTRNEIDVSHDDIVSTAQAVFTDYGVSALRAVEIQYTDWMDPENSEKNAQLAEKMMADSYFTCPAKDLSDSYAEAGGSKVFRYYFTHRSSNSIMPLWAGTFHAEELFYVFGRALHPGSGYTKSELAFSRRLMRYWSNFAKTGNPNIGEAKQERLIHWPPYTRRGKEYLVLAPNSTTVGRGLREKYCAFWNMLIPILQSLK